MYRTLCKGHCVHAIQEGERGNHGVCLSTSRAVHSGVRRMHDLKRSDNSFCLQRNTTAVGMQQSSQRYHRGAILFPRSESPFTWHLAASLH